MKEQDKILLFSLFPYLKEQWSSAEQYFNFRNIPPKTILLYAGETATSIFFILKGCCRKYLIKKNGMEITTQFFWEGQMVSSLESTYYNEPSRFFLETIEPCTLGVIDKRDFIAIHNSVPAMKEQLTSFAFERLIEYIHMFSSFIMDSPEERYRRLIAECPDIIYRIEQQYIASYLGITPVSLSRIKKRISITTPG